MSIVPGRRALQQEASRQPHDPDIHERLARALLAEQDLAALSALQALLDDRFAEHPFTHLVAGHASKARGDVDAALRRYRRALVLQPDSGEALYNLVDLDDTRVSEAEQRHIAELTGRRELPAADRINIHFARARLLDRKSVV